MQSRGQSSISWCSHVAVCEKKLQDYSALIYKKYEWQVLRLLAITFVNMVNELLSQVHWEKRLYTFS